MDTKLTYDLWASQYDTDLNKTRDLEAKALRDQLGKIDFKSCLEIGCGTGKNTVWLSGRATKTTAVDFSARMLEKAAEKITPTTNHIDFIQADVNHSWNFLNNGYDLVVFSLMLEHIENLKNIFSNASKALVLGGYIYVGELHPFKQYIGSKARFETDGVFNAPECFTHHISEYVSSAEVNGLSLVSMNEHFDEDQKIIPRILTLLFKKV